MVMSQEKKCDNGVQMLWAPNFPQQEPYKKKSPIYCFKFKQEYCI